MTAYIKVLFSLLVLLFSGDARADDIVVLPTQPPIPQGMLGGGVVFSAERFDLFVPTLRKSSYDWPGTVYTDSSKSGDTVSISGEKIPLSQVVNQLVQQTGRRFAISKGFNPAVSVNATEAPWLDVITTVAEQSGAVLESVQDVIVIVEPAPVEQTVKKTFLFLLAVGVGVVLLIVGVVVVLKPKRKFNPRGGW